MCEDFPCCGHEPGCCPDYDESGKQLNMKCVCGATLPIDSRYSICESCLRSENDDEDAFIEELEDDFYNDDDDFDDEYPEDDEDYDGGLDQNALL